MRNEQIAVLGIGNILLQDEGVGVRAVEALKKGYDFPENVQLIDGGTKGLDLLPFIEGLDKLLIIDAVNMKKEPGTIAIIEDKDIPSFISTKLSIHQIGFPDLLLAAQLMEIKPVTMTLIGIQPDIIDTGLEMSEAVKKHFDRFVNVVTEKLHEWGVNIKRKDKKTEHEAGAATQ